ncbi:hypothetical protein B0H14DRAFT_1506754 [Mycena olivaceomarginata]|nr:hypothetical protein B0H14DRAFT_1506754 [Mycena olivaceomarginata]
MQLPYRRTPFDGLGPIPWRSPFRLYANPERDASVPRRNRAPEMQNIAERGVINACDKCSTVSVPKRDPELEPQKRADQPRRDVSVPMRDPEPEPRKVANMGVANARDKFLTRHDASGLGLGLDPEPELDAEQATTATAYAGDADSPPPVSLTISSALGGNMNLQLERDVSVPMRDLEPPTVASAAILNAHESFDEPGCVCTEQRPGTGARNSARLNHGCATACVAHKRLVTRWGTAQWEQCRCFPRDG